MPTVPIHEEVAYNIACKYKQLHSLDFYLGAMAPDAVNVNGFAQKEVRWKAHLRSKNLEEWKKNIVNFYEKYTGIYNINFLLGYVVHVMTDIIFDEYYYMDVRNKMISDKIDVEDTHKMMRKDMDNYASISKKYKIIKNYYKDIKVFYDIRNVSEDMLEEWLKKEERTMRLPKESVYFSDQMLKDIAQKVIEELKKRKVLR